MKKAIKRQHHQQGRSRVPTGNDLTEAAGIALISTISNAAKFIFRQSTGVDLGIDAHMEVFDDEGNCGYVLIQSKCKHKPSKSWNSIQLDTPETLLRYWRSMNDPVVLIESKLVRKSDYRAMHMRAIDLSATSIECTASTIKWNLEIEKEQNTVLGWVSIKSVEQFKTFVIQVSNRRKEGALSNAIWLANRALDTSDYEAADRIIEEYEKAYGKCSRSAVQRCRNARRRGVWSPEKTKKELSSIKGHSGAALQEIAYSYFVGALREQSNSAKSKKAKTFIQEGMNYLKRWIATGPRNDCGTVDYILYGQQIQFLIEKHSSITMNRTAAKLKELVKSGGTSAAEAKCSLWRHALIQGKRKDAEYWMKKVWPIFGTTEENLPATWKNKRVPQNFAAAMLYRAWTLALQEKPEAKEVFGIAQIAIKGVIRYPEIEYWMNIASQLCPNLRSS